VAVLAGEQRRNGKRMLEEEVSRRAKKFTKHEMWEVYFFLNMMKIICSLLRGKWRATSWVRKWYEFVKLEAKAGRLSWTNWLGCMTYVGTVEHTRHEYYGETKTGIRRRVQGHIRKALTGGKQCLSRVMRGLGVHRLTWMPMQCWGRMVTKFERLRAEGRMIWARNSSLNEVGVEGQGDLRMGRRLVLFGLRRRFRLPIRLRELEEVAAGRGTRLINEEDREARREEEMRKRKKTFATLARLARRPWPKDVWKHPTRLMEKIQVMKVEEVKRLVRGAYMGLDCTGRSIAVANMKKALARRRGVQWVYLRLGSPMFAVDKMKTDVERALKQYAQEWERRGGVLVVLVVTAGTKASESIIGGLGDTARRSKAPKEQQK